MLLPLLLFSSFLLPTPILSATTTTSSTDNITILPIPSYCSSSNCTDTSIFCHHGYRWVSFEKWPVRRDLVVTFEQHAEGRTFEVASKDEWNVRLSTFSSPLDPVQRLSQKKMPSLYHVLHIVEQILSFGWLSKLGGIFQSSTSGIGHIPDDYRCHKHECRFTTSPYDKACLRMIHPLPSKVNFKVTVQHRSDFINIISIMLISVVIIYLAPRISHQPMFFYLSGGTIGIFFAISVLILLFFKTTRPAGESPKATHYSIAFFIQSLAYYFRTSLAYLANEYFEFILLYVCVAFFLSVFLIHWMIKRPDGTSGVNGAVLDTAHVCVLLFGIGLGAYSLPSPRHGLIYGVVLLGLCLSRWFEIFNIFEVMGLEQSTSSWSSRQQQYYQHVSLGNGYSTPIRHNNNVQLSREARVNMLRSPTRWYDNLLRPFSTPRNTNQAPRRFMTEQEYINSGKKTTTEEMAKLSQSPAFHAWLIQNTNRLMVRKNSDDDVDDNGEDEGSLVDDGGEDDDGEDNNSD
jgi:hypothetical protein